MEDNRNKIKQCLAVDGRSRRRFLKEAAVATAGSSIIALSAMSQSTTGSVESLAPRSCSRMNNPMKEVAGKVAFITGGSSGIGLGIARAFADAGMKIALGYRTPQHLDEAMKHLAGLRDRVHPINVDVTDRPGMRKAAEETIKVFGKIHVLVNNAGIAHPAALSSTTFDDWDWTIAVNLNGVFNGVHVFLPHIRDHGEGGHIITTSSVLGLFAMGAGMAAYSASKFAVVGLMESLYAELADTNIGVSIFCPGMIRSNITDASRNRPSDLSETTIKADSESKARQRELRLELDTDPLEAGQLVLRGMRNNDLFILTHPEYEQFIRARCDALIASIPADIQASEKRLTMVQTAFRRSIYALEHARKRCPRAARS